MAISRPLAPSSNARSRSSKSKSKNKINRKQQQQQQQQTAVWPPRGRTDDASFVDLRGRAFLRDLGARGYGAVLQHV